MRADDERLLTLIVGGAMSILTGVAGYFANGWVTRKTDAAKAGLIDATTRVTAEITAQGQFQDRLLKRVEHLEQRLDEAEKETDAARKDAEEARRLHWDCEQRCSVLETRLAHLEREMKRDRGHYG